MGPIVPRRAAFCTRAAVKLRTIVATLLVAAVGAACATVPYTGRKQFSTMSEAEEQRLGEQLYFDMKRETRISPDGPAQGVVREVGQRIAGVADQPTWRWEFTLFDDPKQVNAWALPGGKVGIYTGILPIAKDEAGLAAIMGHEVAHAIAHHAAERASQNQVFGILGAGVGIAAGAALGAETGDAAMQIFGLGTEVGVLLPFGRAQESEADEIGLILMAKAGYDPRAAIGLWERMGEIERKEGASPEFLSTHPGYETRLERIRAALPTALQYYRGGPTPRPLPAVDRLAKADPADTALLDAVSRLDQLTKRNARGVLNAIAAEFRLDVADVLAFAKKERFSGGETALVLALFVESGKPVGDVVRVVRAAATWDAAAKKLGVPRETLAGRLDRVADRVRA